MKPIEFGEWEINTIIHWEQYKDKFIHFNTSSENHYYGIVKNDGNRFNSKRKLATLNDNDYLVYHNTEGPAFISASGYHFYAIDGYELTKEEFQKFQADQEFNSNFIEAINE